MKELSKLDQILENHTSLYLIDLSWCLYRFYHTFTNFKVDMEGVLIPTGHLYGMFTAIKSIIIDDPNACIIICQDGRPVERDKIMNESGLDYKEGRPDREYDFYKDCNKVKALFCYVPNVYWAYNEDKESDDEMYALAKQAEQVSSFTGPIFIYSGDNDLLQSIDSRISVIRNRVNNKFSIINEEVVTTDEQFTKKFYGVAPKDLVEFRVIVGDPSDHIHGIPRFPRNIAKSIATIPNWRPITDKESKWYKVYVENQAIVNRNRSLMKLSSDYEVQLSKPVVNKEKFVALLYKLKFRSYLSWLEEKGLL